MKRLTILAVLACSLFAAAPAGAITDGAPDGHGHPNVGGLVASTVYSDGTWIYCSGTLISPTVFLTAAHCAEGDQVSVTFDADYQAGDKILSAMPAGDTPGKRTSVTKYNVATRMKS